jgi:uncharacterized protein YbaP (TraB family)
VLGTGGIASHAVFGADAARDACTPSDRSATCRYQKGVLWKLERSGSNPSYLFGTIHVADRRVTDLPPIVRDTFNSARSFTMELLIDGSGLAQMAETMFFTDGRTLEAAIGAQRYAAVQRLFAERGLPQTDLQRQKPWVIVMMLSSPRPGGIALDLQLQLDAMQQQKPTHGLETLAEQLAVFNELALDDQLALLDATLRQAPKLDAMIESMVQAYLARDLARVMAIMDSSALEDRRLQETVMARLVTTRNQRMFERMRPRLDEGSAFIAVGAAHLAGRGGLLPLLEQAGWRVTPVY